MARVHEFTVCCDHFDQSYGIIVGLVLWVLLWVFEFA